MEVEKQHGAAQSAVRSAPHRRWNPLLEEWVLVSPQRAQRPWSGELVATQPGAEATKSLTTFVADCYLCAGNPRIGGQVNPEYDSVFVFENDFPALVNDSNESSHTALNQLIRSQPATGICRVLCYSPIHGASLADLGKTSIVRVIEEWQNQYAELTADPKINHVMIFENKGQLMGASNPHPHGQIWATDAVPQIPQRQAEAQLRYFEAHRRHLLSDYLDWEQSQQERVVMRNEYWTVVVPYWAVWPFETLVLPNRPVSVIAELLTAEKQGWSEIMQRLVRIYDRVFDVTFPYSMGIYQKPVDQEWTGFTLHQVFLPPLLRSASVRKYMVGYELCAEPQRDLTPEQAAARLQQCAESL